MFKAPLQRESECGGQFVEEHSTQLALPVNLELFLCVLSCLEICFGVWVIFLFSANLFAAGILQTCLLAANGSPAGAVTAMA